MKRFLVIISFVVVSLAVIAGTVNADEIVVDDNNCQGSFIECQQRAKAERIDATLAVLAYYLNNYCLEYKITLGE